MSTLYLVSTPIGNLEDLTRRAERVLGEVGRVLAEDTRRTGTLLRHLGLDTPMYSLHEHNERTRSTEVVRWLDEGEDLALVSDAGTPAVSDPGERTVRAVVAAGHEVVPVPGPSAVLSALVASGLPAERFVFLGFPPRKGTARNRFLDRVVHSDETAVLFESPERLLDLLESLADRSEGSRRVCVAREITKIHEEFVRGTLDEAAAYYREHPPRGEVSLVVEPAPLAPADPAVDRRAVEALAGPMLAEGRRPSQVAREVARRLSLPRRDTYHIVHSIEGRGSPNEGTDEVEG